MEEFLDNVFFIVPIKYFARVTVLGAFVSYGFDESLIFIRFNKKNTEVYKRILRKKFFVLGF